jgi:hypothetical protein
MGLQQYPCQALRRLTTGYSILVWVHSLDTDADMTAWHLDGGVADEALDTLPTVYSYIQHSLSGYLLAR